MAHLSRAIPASKRHAHPQITAWRSTECSRCWADPATRVEMMSAEPPPARAAPAPPADSAYFRVVDGYVVVDAASWTQAMARGGPRQVRSNCRPRSAKPPASCSIAVSASAQPNDGQSFFLNTFLTGLLPMIVEGSASARDRTVSAAQRLSAPTRQFVRRLSIVVRVEDAEHDCRTGEGEEALGVLIDERTPRSRRS